MCLQGSALSMSQKQGCKVQIKLLTEEVANYQLIGIAFNLTVIPWNPLWILVRFGGKTLRWPEMQEIWVKLQLYRGWLTGLDHHGNLEPFCALDLALKKKWLFGKWWLNSNDRKYSCRINWFAAAVCVCLGRWRSRMRNWEEDTCPWISGVFNQLCSLLILSWALGFLLLVIQNVSNGLFKLFILKGAQGWPR